MALNTQSIEIDSVVSFEFWPSMLLGPGLTMATVEGILKFSDANHYIDVVQQHIAVYPTLPAGTPNDPKQYYYLKLRTISGETTVVGIPWIKEDTWTVSTSQSYRITIPNVSAADIEIINMQLKALGYTIIDPAYLN